MSLWRLLRVGIDEIENDWQKEDWLDEQNGFIRSYVVSDTSKGATAWQSDLVRNMRDITKDLEVINSSFEIWGFAVVDGLKRYVRRIHFIGPKGETIQARMVFDYGESSRSSTKRERFINLISNQRRDK